VLIGTNPRQASEKLKALQQEYELALARHATRRKRRLEQTQQPTVADRQWLAELAEVRVLPASTIDCPQSVTLTHIFPGSGC
jgi:hypothetical protein